MVNDGSCLFIMLTMVVKVNQLGDHWGDEPGDDQ